MHHTPSVINTHEQYRHLQHSRKSIRNAVHPNLKVVRVDEDASTPAHAEGTQSTKARVIARMRQRQTQHLNITPRAPNGHGNTATTFLQQLLYGHFRPHSQLRPSRVVSL